jgi:hypothetical protein
MNALQQFHTLLQNKGVPLTRLGLRDIALERSDALVAVALLRKASCSILGGDVYFKRGSEIEIAYANWHSDPKADENHVEFVHRSCLETENYIEQFPASGALPLFVLVFTEKDEGTGNMS